MTVRIIALFLLCTCSGICQNLKQEYVRQLMALDGPQGAVAGQFEFRIDGATVLFRHSIGSSDEPYGVLRLPRAAKKIAADDHSLFVWVEGSELWQFEVGEDGPAQIARLIPADSREAAEALRRHSAPALVDSAGRSDAVISPQRLFVANNGTGTSAAGIAADSVTVINTQTNAAISTVSFKAGDGPAAVAVAPDNSKAYVGLYGSCNTCVQRGMAVLDPDKLQVTGTIPNATPAVLTLSPDGSLLYNSNLVYGLSEVDVYSTKTLGYLGRVSLGLYPQDLALTADGKTLYVIGSFFDPTNGRQDSVYVIDTTAMKLTATYSNGIAGEKCGGIRLSPDEKKLYLACVNNSKVLVVDPSTGKVLASYVTSAALSLALSPDGKKLYVPHPGTGVLDVLDAATGNRLNQITAGDSPLEIVVNNTGTRAYLSNVLGNTVSVVDLVNETLVTKVPVGPGPTGMALTIPPPDFSATPGSLVFNGGGGQADPAAQTVSLAATSTGSFSFTVSAATISGGNWLSVSPASGTLPGTLSVSVKTAGLTSGTYTGAVTVAVPNTASATRSISVSLQIGATARIVVGSPEVDFQSVAGAPAPASQAVQITNGVAGAMNWTASVTGAASWLSLSPSSGTAPGSLALRVDPTGLSAASYQATVSVTSADATNSPQTFKVVYVLLPGPTVPSDGLVHAASFAKNAPVSPGSIVSIFGTNLGPAAGVGALSIPLQTVLADVKVLLGGVAAPLIYVSATQINCQVPYELSSKTSAALVVQNGTASSPPVNISLAPAAPGIFTVTIGTRTQGAVLNQDYSLNTPANPAHAADVIQIFATGHGAVTNQPASGAAALDAPLSTTSEVPTVLVGGRQATVQFSGLTPGLVGLWQINVNVPADVQPGDSVSLQLVYGNSLSNSVILAVGAPPSP